MNPFLTMATDPAAPYAIAFVLFVLAALVAWMFTK
jgi:hypothetical protein